MEEKGLNGDISSLEALSNEEALSSCDSLLSVEYSLNEKNEDYGYRLFQKKFVYKKCLINSILFCIPLLLFIGQLIKNPGYEMGWCLAAICLGIIVMQWVNQIVIRKNLLKALGAIEGDIYRFEIFNSFFRVSTVGFIEDIEKKYDTESNNDEEINLEDKSEEKTPLPPPIEYNFFDHELEVIENDEHFTVFIMETKLYYVLPKSFFSAEQIDVFRNFMKKKLENKYQTV